MHHYKGAISVFFLFVFYLFSGELVRTFINNEKVIAYGIQIMNALIISLPFAGIQFLIRVSFQALGEGTPALILALAREGFFYISLLLILNHLFGFSGFIYAQPIANILTFFLAMILFQRVRAKITNENESVNKELPPSKLKESYLEA